MLRLAAEYAESLALFRWRESAGPLSHIGCANMLPLAAERAESPTLFRWRERAYVVPKRGLEPPRALPTTPSR